MKDAAQRWVKTTVVGVSLLAAAGAAPAADVTDADRVFENFTRETSTVAEGQLRIEVRGMHKEELAAGGTPDCNAPRASNCTRLNLIGQRVLGVQQLSGGEIDLLLSYGLLKNMEAGIIIPGFIETLELNDGSHVTNEDIGDITLYGKFQRTVAKHCAVGAGVEFTLPNGPDQKQETIEGHYSGFGTGKFSSNPFVSARYRRGAFAVGTHVGYQIFAGDVKDVFNYSVQAIVRGSPEYALRAELSGRVFDEFGTRWHDAVVLPGIDFNVTDNFTVRPTGLANVTGTALDWGIGLGLALTL